MPRRRLTDALTLRGRALLATGCALVVCGVGLGFRDITRIGVLVAGLPLLVLLLSRRPLTLATSREVRPTMVAPDEACDVLLRVGNTGSTATPIIMAEEQLDYALGDRPRFVIPRMAPGASHQLPYRVRGTLRGRHRLGPLGLRIKDPFDLTLRLAVVRDVGELIVLPTVIPLGGGALTGGLGYEGSTPHMIALHGEDDVSVREWRDGDDLRRIHWPATAHTGDLMVRQEDRPSTRRIVILLDDRDRIGDAPRSGGSFEWAVTAAASIASLAAESGASMHLALGGRLLAGHSAGEQLALDEVLLALAVAEPLDAMALATSVDRAMEAATAGAVCIAVLMAMDDEDVERVSRIRPPGSAGLALVQEIGTPGSPNPEVTATRLRERGWSSVVVRPGMGVDQAWQSLQAGAAVGTRR